MALHLVSGAGRRFSTSCRQRHPRTARSATQLALAAAVLDELEVHLVPVLLGQGRRRFDHRTSEHAELDRVRTLEGEDGVTHLRYRVRR